MDAEMYFEDDKHEAVQKAMRDMAKEGAKKGGKALKAVSSQEDKRSDIKQAARCKLAYQVFNESLDMYKDGEMTFSEMIEDLSRSLKAID